MIPRPIAVNSRRFIRNHRVPQILLLIAVWLAGEAIVRLTGLPLPGSVIGLGLALILLLGGRISRHSLRRGADWFLGEMLLFFVPAVLAVIDHREFLGVLGLKLLVVILSGTVTVMIVTGLVVELFSRWMSRDEPAS